MKYKNTILSIISIIILICFAWSYRMKQLEENADLRVKSYIESLNKQEEALNDLIEKRRIQMEIEIARLRQR